MMRSPTKPRPGDRVAVLSPGAALPAIFPAPFDLGLQRLADEFDLVPVEYPTTRRWQSTPAERAADVNAAFADDGIAAILTSIGGDDQIKVLRHLDAEVLRANPKPFFGVSDNTNLNIFLWNLGIVSYYGGTVMTDLGRPGAMNPDTAESLRAALFTDDPFRLRPAETYTDIGKDWKAPHALDTEPEMLPGGGWSWYGPRRPVTGTGWGGCLEIVDWHLRAHRYLQPPEAYAGAVLFLETSEEMPDASYVYRVLVGMGERGMLQQFAAILLGRPKAWEFDRPNTPQQKDDYITAQRDAVLRALTEYHPDVPLVCNVDLGHTDPHLTVPSGGTITIDPTAEAITVGY